MTLNNFESIKLNLIIFIRHLNNILINLDNSSSTVEIHSSEDSNFTTKTFETSLKGGDEYSKNLGSNFSEYFQISIQTGSTVESINITARSYNSYEDT